MVRACSLMRPIGIMLLIKPAQMTTILPKFIIVLDMAIPPLSLTGPKELYVSDVEVITWCKTCDSCQKLTRLTRKWNDTLQETLHLPLANWLHGIFHFHLKAICSTSWCHHFLVMMLPFPSFKQILAIDLWLLNLNCARFYFPNHLQSDNNLLFCPKCHKKKK